MNRIGSLFLLCGVHAALAASDLDPIRINNRIAFWDQVFEWSYSLYFGLFFLGALMVVLSVVVRRLPSAKPVHRRFRELMFSLGMATLLFLCALSQQTQLDNKRGFIADREKRYEQLMTKLEKSYDRNELLRAEYLYLPVGKSLAFMTAGNTGVAADYLYLTSMQYVHGNFRRWHKFDLLLKIYTAMVDMDPHWIEAELNAGKVLSALEPDRFAVERFYMRCIQENPDDWRLPYGAGYLFIVPPENYDRDQKIYSNRARDWIDDALRHSSFPSDLRGHAVRLKARVGIEADFNEEADEIFYAQMTDPNASDAMKTVAAREWMNAHSRVMTQNLQLFVDAYTLSQGTPPKSLRQVMRGDWIVARQYATDAFGYEFEYNPVTTTVSSRGVKVRQTLMIIGVLQPLVDAYKNEHNGQTADDMFQIRDWLREYFGPANPPTPAVKQALGSDIDPTRSPLGQWNYNRFEGRIVLPDWCTVERLYQNVERLVHNR